MIYTALDTFYVSPQQIADSPSRKDGVDEPTESLLRRFGCELIQESGILLKMPQAAMATGQVLFHRFYCKKSFSRFNVKRVAASCVWLASKLEESPRRMTDILNVFYRIDCRRENREIDFPDHKKYEEMKVDLIRTERHLLKEMGFICHVEHPHKFILNYLLQLEAPPELMQEAWNLANDSLRTTLCVRFKSEVVACGVVYAAARRFRVPLPENPPWWQVFDAEKSDVEEVCRVLGDLYRQPKAHYAEVRKDAKSFVLTSTAWDPPPDTQVNLLKVVGNGSATVMQLPSASPDARPQNTNTTGDRSKIAVAKDTRTDFQELQTSSGNGELRDDQSVGKTKLPNDKEDGGSDNSRLKDRNRQLTENEKDRDRDRERDNRDRTRERDRDREKDREKEREREKLRERVHRSKDRSRDPGHADKLRHRPSSRDHEFQNSHALIREKERHRYHPYV